MNLQAPCIFKDVWCYFPLEMLVCILFNKYRLNYAGCKSKKLLDLYLESNAEEQKYFEKTIIIIIFMIYFLQTK
jgi:hypothetical protein